MISYVMMHKHAGGREREREGERERERERDRETDRLCAYVEMQHGTGQAATDRSVISE